MNPVLRKRLWIVGVVVFLPVLLLLFAHLHGKWALARLKKQLVLRGEKLTIGQNEPSYGRGENSFRQFMQAVNMAKGSDAGSFSPPMLRPATPGTLVPLRYLTNWPSNRGRSNVNWAILTAALEPFTNALTEAKSLLHEPVLDPRLDYRLGFSMPLPHLAQLKGFCQLLSAATAVSLQAGQLEIAKDHIKDTLATADVLEREPLLISQLVRCAMISIAVGSTWHALQRPEWTDAQLLDLQRTWQSIEVLPQFIAAMEMERAITIDTFAAMRRSSTVLNNYLTGGGGGNGASDPGEFLAQAATRNILIPIWQVSLSYGDERHYLEILQTQLELSRVCAKQRSGIPAREVKDQLEQAKGESGFARFRHLMSWNFATSVSRTLERGLTTETQKELVVAAIALRRYSLRHGHLPATLGELVPEWLEAVPRDYWAGAPLLYNTNAAAPLLYSVGSDGVDGGGDAGVVGSSSTPSVFNGRDIVWPTPIPEEKLGLALKVLNCNVTNATNVTNRR